MAFVVVVCVLSTSLILLAAGAEHAAGQAKLRSRLRMHQLLGPRWVGPVGIGLPVLELFGAIASLWSVAVSSRSGLVASLLFHAALYWSFAGYLVAVVRAGKAGIPCGCGPGEVPVGRSAIARAVVLALLACVSAVGVSALELESLAIRADARGLLACVAGITFGILLVILPPSRRVEPLANPHNVTGAMTSP